MTTSRSFSCIAAWSRSKPAATPRRHTVTSPKATATRSGWKRTGDAAEGPRRGHHRGPRRRSRAGELPHLRPDPRLHHHQRGLHDMTPISELTDRTRRAQDKARVLNEALPWLTRWAGRTIVVKFGAAGAAAVGVAGTDAGLVTAAARDPRLGFVGDVLAVDPAILLTLLSDGVVPVVATVARLSL